MDEETRKKIEELKKLKIGALSSEVVVIVTGKGMKITSPNARVINQ